MENIIFVAFHKEALDDKGKVIVPPCIITFQQTDECDCFGEKLIAKSVQRYARPNKKLGSIMKVDDFKGKLGGCGSSFYEVDSIVEELKMLTDEDYNIKRMTTHGENDLADYLFQELKEYSFNRLREKGAFKLPS